MAILPNLTAALNNLIGAPSPQGFAYGEGPRDPWVFSSRLRQLSQDAVESDEDILLDVTSEGLSGFSPLAAGTLVDVVMEVNQNSVSFKQPKRIQEKKLKEGSVFYHFTNSRGQNNDILRLSFRGNTGNLDQRGDDGSGAGFANGARSKLLVWHNLWQLTRERMLLPDGTENHMTIDYLSKLFPVSLRFQGFYSQVLDFEENADKPNSLDYAFEFTVTDTEPDLDEISTIVFEALEERQLSGSTGAASDLFSGINLSTQSSTEIGGIPTDPFANINEPRGTGKPTT